MSRLELSCYGIEHYPSDVDRIVRVCVSNGYDIDRRTAADAWERYSEDYYAAGWLMLPDDDAEILNAIITICEVSP